MAGSPVAREALMQHTPHTFNALQTLVMAMEGAERSAGKKTFFGRDKGQEAYAKFLAELKKTLHSLVLDGQIQESTATPDVLAKLEQVCTVFASGFPNWPDAYRYGDRFLSAQNRPNALALVERLRSQA